MNTSKGEFVFQDTEELSLPDQMDILVKAKTELGLPISDDHVYETFNIPKPDNYDELKTKAEAIAATQRIASPPENKPPAGKQTNAQNKGLFGFFR